MPQYSPLSPAQWARLEALFDAALAQPAGQREVWIAAQGLSEAERAALTDWLAAEAESSQFLTAQGAAAVLPAGERVGAWQVLDLIGRGGSGEVYRVARADGSYEQEAALKLLARSDEADDLRRFAAERRLLARLAHPDIARLLDGGAHAGRPYAVLELVQGTRLDTAVAGWPLSRKLTLFRRIVAAVAHAHRHLIVHRDLKPANVLVTPDGAPKLLDFGIAKPIETTATEATLALRLTPDYCAPEQLRGEHITPAADVFALGVMLHELLTEQPCWPLSGAGVQRALDRLAAPEVVLPSSRLHGAAAKAVRGDLDAIVMKALRPDPATRYASAGALLDDLERAGDGRPVAARGEATAYLLSRLLRRHRLAVGAATAVLLALLLGAAGIAWQAREAALERDMARQEALRSAAVKDYLLTLFRIAGESQGETLTHKQLLDKGAARLQQFLDKNPQASADTLLALAELYFRLNDYLGAAPLFEQLLRRTPPITADLAARVQLDLALCYLRMSRYPEARQALAAAQGFWQQAPQRWRNLLLESRSTEAQLARAEGRMADSLSILQAALDERIEVSGEAHHETATLLNDLAVAHFQANQFELARPLFERAMAAWQALSAAESVDALNTLNNWAALELRENRLAEAEQLFTQALNTRRALFGPSAALAALLNNVGKLHLKLNRPEAALPLLTEALTLARQFAGDNSLLALSAQLGLGEAQATLRQPTAASTLEDAEARIAQHFAPPHPLAGTAQLAQARRLAAVGQKAAALARLDAAENLLQQAGPPGAAQLPQVQALRQSLR